MQKLWFGLHNYHKLAFPTRSRFEPALAYNPLFSRNLSSNACLEHSIKITTRWWKARVYGKLVKNSYAIKTHLFVSSSAFKAIVFSLMHDF